MLTRDSTYNLQFVAKFSLNGLKPFLPKLVLVPFVHMLENIGD